MTQISRDFRQGLTDIAPVLVAATPMGLLWGTLAAGKGLSPLEAGLTSAMMFAAAAQFVAIELWRDPAPWLLLTATVFLVNIRHILMGASVSRHMSHMSGSWRFLLMLMMADNNWAFSERRALTARLSSSYYWGLTLPMMLVWTSSSTIGVLAGRSLGDPAALGFDFAFSAMFIGILADFWKGPRTGAVLMASAIAAALVKIYVPGAWYIVAGGLAGVAAAAMLHRENELP